MVSYEDFAKIELKIGRVLSAQRIENSDKLLKLEVDLGEPEKRQIIAGIGKIYGPEDVIGREIVVVANLEPRTLMGFESQGMLLAASDEDGPVLLMPDKIVEPGNKIK